MKILFLGSPHFAAKVMQGVLDAGHTITTLICKPDRPASRGKKISMPEAKEFAISQGIQVLQFENVNQHIEEIKKIDFDIFITASFGQILSRQFLEIGLGLNVHPSMLPLLRGATPIQTALLQNMTSTGVTIQRMRYEMDAGEILEQASLDIDPNDDYVSLEEKLALLAIELLNSGLKKIENNTYTFTPQKGQPTFTNMITKEDGRLNFDKSAAENIGKVRALAHNPGAYFDYVDGRVKVLKCALASDNILYSAGEIIPNKNHFIIKCKEGSIEIISLISPSGKTMDGKSFLNGLRDVTRL